MGVMFNPRDAATRSLSVLLKKKKGGSLSETASTTH